MFSQNQGSGLNAYRNVGVESMATTADPHKLVLMLFNGARAAIAAAKGQLERREIAAKGASISKAISIIEGGLKASLDMNVGGELAKNLSDLYVYMGQRLLYANLKNDRDALDEVAKLLEQLGGAWEEIAAKTVAANKAAAAARQDSRSQPYASQASAAAAPKPMPPAGATYAMPPGARAMPHEPAPARAAPPAVAKPEAHAAKIAAPAAAPPPPDYAADANPRPINRVAAAYGVR